MLTNYHTHTHFCDGASAPEEIVLRAIEQGFSAIGFSGHGTTPFDLSYCMTDTEAYIAEISRLKSAYGQKIQIYLGVEEDALALVDRSRFDYLIGSSHYLRVGDRYLSVDSGQEYFERCLSAFDGDVTALARAYFGTLCDYLASRKPDIVGHFDLITKYEETQPSILLSNPAYRAVAEHYIGIAADMDCLFEVNTGAMSRGIRTAPYPAEHLLTVLRKREAKIILSSDSHHADTLSFGFEELRAYLRDLGFRHVYEFLNHEFVRTSI